jgi:hypothetical protein
VLLHDLDQLSLDGAVHVVDLVVHGEDGLGELGVAFEERLDGGADHDADLFAHVGRCRRGARSGASSMDWARWAMLEA